jgi:hypothetical protein
MNLRKQNHPPGVRFQKVQDQIQNKINSINPSNYQFKRNSPKVELFEVDQNIVE